MQDLILTLRLSVSKIKCVPPDCLIIDSSILSNKYEFNY